MSFTDHKCKMLTMKWLLNILLATSAPSSWLRIIQINDVYQLDHFPRLKSLVNAKKQGPDETLIVCAGDFVSPSLLSSLDKGASLVDCLNQVGVTHVCLGNHEADIALEELKARIQSSQFEWINTNAPELNEKLGILLPKICTIQVQSKTVALLGLLTDEPGLYNPGAFGDATILPVQETAKAIAKKLRSEQQIDLIVPLTHQSIEEDREFCEALGSNLFPMLCGGHDHEVYHEIVNGCHIVKTGSDAINAGVIDIRWNGSNDDDSPQIDVEIEPTANYLPDSDLEQRVKAHQKITHELEQAKIFRISDWMDSHFYRKTVSSPTDPVVFSTENNRLGPSTGTTALCTMMRMGLRAQCAILNAGAVRASKKYEKQEYFTWSDLKAEITYSTGMVACYIPGRVLEAAIAYSREPSTRQPPVAFGGYLHTCSNIDFNDDTAHIESIRGELFDPDRMYLTALPAKLLTGMDDQRPLLEWVASRSKKQLPLSEEPAIPAKMVVIEVFSTMLWLQLGCFDSVDLNKDGELQKDEVRRRLVEMYGDESVADLVLDNMFSIADMTNSGTITPLEMMIVQFVATDIIDHVCSRKELQVMKEVASTVLGVNPSHEEVKRMVERIRDTIDLQGDGTIHRSEVLKALGTLSRSEMLK